ncbi:SBBP repeat-containing protein [candidate division KSB1 bacterium]|nr:SBBP repeat-containing protein [candidate division KSB1 bacterium]
MENPFYNYQQLKNSQVPHYPPFSPFNYYSNLRHVHKPQIPNIPCFTTGVKEDWARIYESRSLPSWDSATDITIDGEGNVYVTGYSTNMQQGLDFCTIKYDTDGNQLWAEYFNGKTNGDDIAKNIALDDSGNVYVGGNSTGSGSGLDFIVVKYNNQGQKLWVARYEGINHRDAVLQDMIVDNLGNVYLTGESNDYFVTVKINNEGVQQWAVQYRGPANYDFPMAIALDGAGNVYVTGFSKKSETNHFGECTTLKYNLNGEQIWQASYSSADSADDIPKDIAVGDSGTVYVTGISYLNGNSDFFTIKYDSNGQEAWADIYDGTGNFSNDDYAETINLDSEGNIYVTGSTEYNYDMSLITIKYQKNGNRQWISRYRYGDFRAVSAKLDRSDNIYVLGYGHSNNYEGNDFLVVKYTSEGSQAWATRYQSLSQSWSQPSAIAINDRCEVFLTGEKDDLETGFDYITVKFDSNGNQQWERDFNGSYREDGEAVALQIDGNGDVIAFGGSGNKFVTTKYSAQGTFKWAASFDGREYYSGNNKSLAVDALGNVFVTTANRADPLKWSYDFVTIKYNANGVQQWLSRYDKDERQQGGNRQNFPGSIVVDQIGNTYVTGRSLGQSGNYDIVTIRYNPDGVEQWVNRFRSNENYYAEATDLAIDKNGNIIVSGIIRTDESNILIIKYNAKGREQWVTTTPDETSYYMDASMTLDDWGNIYVLSNRDKSCMMCSMVDFDNCVILKYNSAGEKQWIIQRAESENPSIGRNIGIDILGNVYICGFNLGSNPSEGFVIKKYNADGVELWSTSQKQSDYLGYPRCLVLDLDCNVYVAGDIWNEGTGSDVNIAKYNSQGEEKWTIHYNDPRNTNDVTRDMKVDKLGNIFVAGSTEGKYWSNYKVLKFSQTGADTLTTPIISGYELKNNIPNPFRTQTLIYYTLPKASKVKIKVFNQLGQQVAFEDLGKKPEGKYAFHFQTNDLTSGIYFYQLKAGEFMKTKKMILIQ